MPRINSQVPIDTSGQWDRASQVLQGKGSVEASTATPTTSSSAKPIGPSPVSPEHSRWSDWSSKKPESSQSDSVQGENASSVPADLTDVPTTMSASVDAVPQEETAAPSLATASVVPDSATPQNPSLPCQNPPAPALLVQLPFTGSPLRLRDSTLSSPPPVSPTSAFASAPDVTFPSPLSEPPPTPSTGQPQPEPLPPRFQRPVDSQFQTFPYLPSAPYIEGNPAHPQATLTQPGPAPHFTDTQRMQSYPTSRTAGASQGSAGAKTPVTSKRTSDGFVAYDPFRSGSNRRKVEKVSNDITFDDIGITASLVGSRRESQTQHFQYQPSQPGSYQIPQLTGSYQPSQAMAPHQNPQTTGPYDLTKPTGLDPIPQSIGAYPPSRPIELYQIPQSTGTHPQTSQPTGSDARTQGAYTSQHPGAYQVTQATGTHPTSQSPGSYQILQTTGISQPSQFISQPTVSYQTLQHPTVYDTHLPPNQQYHTLPPTTSYPYQASVQGVQAPQPTTQYIGSTQTDPTNLRPFPVPSTTQGETPISSQLPNTPPVVGSPGQMPTPHAPQSPYSHQYSQSYQNTPVQWGTGTPLTRPYYDQAVPPGHADYGPPYSASSPQETAPLASQLVTDQVVHNQSLRDPHQRMPSTELWPEYPTSYKYPPDSPFDLTPVVNRSLWSRIGNFFLWPLLWIRGETESDMAEYHSPTTTSRPEEHGRMGTFVRETLPRTIYISLLLHWPSFYFGRVARIFEDADLTLVEIKKMALETAGQGPFDFRLVEENTSIPPHYQRLAAAWQAFIDDIMKEWQTFNIISVLLLIAILTNLSNVAAAEDPATRYCGLCSLVCALISLLFGCMYIIRFGSMRKTYKAAEWALEAKKTDNSTYWNVWVWLALPVVWLSWSILLFLLCITCFIWRVSPIRTAPPPVLSDSGLLGIRLVLTFIILIGIGHVVPVFISFNRYGERMDIAWKRRINHWREERSNPSVISPTYNNPVWYPAAQYQPYPSAQESYDAVTPAAPAQAQDSDTPGQRVPSYIAAGYGGYSSDDVRLREYHTQLNTMLNRSNSRYTTNGSAENPPTASSEPPTPPSKSPSLIARLSAPKPQLALLPPPSLPTIPGTPRTIVDPNSTGTLVDSPGQVDGGYSPHVRFRSPLASEHGGSVSPSHANPGPFSRVLEHNHYPPNPAPPQRLHLDIYTRGSDDSFDPYKHPRHF